MSRTVTLSQLEDDVRFQADLIGATVRHTSAQVRRLINQSIQAFREDISNDGNTHYLVPYSGTLTVGATSPFSFLSLDLSAISPAIVRTYMFEVTKDGAVHSLEHRPFTEHNVWSGPSVTGFPRNWAHYQTAKLAIQPAPDATYAYTLWYLPVLADLSADASTFDGVAGWEEWIVWDVVCRLLIRDQQSAAFGTAKVYRDDTWARIKRQATRVSQAGGAVVGRDTLRGRVPDFLAARQAVMAGGGPPASGSVTLDMMADMTGPAVIGRISGTGRPIIIGPSGITNFLVNSFTPSNPGLVPAAGGSSTTKFLSQAGTFETVAAGGGGTPGGPSGSIQFAGLSGFVGYTGFAVQGAPPSMTVRLPGTLRVTGGSVEVGSGTVKMSASGLHVGGGVIEGVASLVADQIGALSYFLQPGGSGIGNETLANMASGTVKAALSLGAPGDVQIPTLAAFFPTFTAGRAGLVPSSDGNTDNFLRADGAFAVPPGSAANPGGGLGAVQYRDSIGGFAGASGITITGSGAAATTEAAAPNAAALTFGGTGAGAEFGSIRAAGHFSIYGLSPSGLPLRVLALSPTGQAALGATGGAALQFGTPSTDRYHVINHGVASGGKFTWRIGSNSVDAAWLSPSGFELTDFHVAARSLHVFSGIPNTELSPMPSGTVRARVSGLGTPQDTYIPTLMAFFPTFTSARPGLVPASDGSSTNFLAGDGAFRAPSGAHQFPPAAGATNEQLASVASGTVKGRLTQGVPQDLLIPTLAAFFPTFTSVRAGLVPVGDGQATSFLAADAAFRAPSGAHQFPPAAGATNDQLAAVPSGTVKGRLSAGVPSDIRIPTLAAFFPTFTSSRAGLVAPGDGDTAKFLNAAGAFTTPVAAATPGGDSGNVQWNLGGAMAGASGIHALGGGAFLGLGPSPLVANMGDLRVASGFSIVARNPSGIAQPMLDWFSASGIQRMGGSGLPKLVQAVASGGVQEFSFGGVTATTAQLTPSGFDLSNFHIKAKSIDVEHIKGLPTDQNALKRGIDISTFAIGGTGNAIPSGLQLYLPRGAGSGANRYIIPSGIVGTGTQFVTLNPTGARAGGVIRIEKLSTSGSNFEVRTPTGTVLHAFPSGTKSTADFFLTKPSGAVFELGGASDLF
jgi:hypothetical protein